MYYDYAVLYYVMCLIQFAFEEIGLGLIKDIPDYYYNHTALNKS